MTEKEDYALPLWLGPLLAILCVGLKAGISLLLRARESRNTSQSDGVPKDQFDSAGVHSCSKQAVLCFVYMFHFTRRDCVLRS